MSADTQPSTRVDFSVVDNGDWEDALQLGDPEDQTWNLNGAAFYLDIKGDDDDASSLLSLSTGAGTIVVNDPIGRVISMNLPHAQWGQVVERGKPYRYDMLMVQAGVQTPVFHGELKMHHGITKGP